MRPETSDSSRVSSILVSQLDGVGAPMAAPPVHVHRRSEAGRVARARANSAHRAFWDPVHVQTREKRRVHVHQQSEGDRGTRARAPMA